MSSNVNSEPPIHKFYKEHVRGASKTFTIKLERNSHLINDIYTSGEWGGQVIAVGLSLVPSAISLSSNFSRRKERAWLE